VDQAKARAHAAELALALASRQAETDVREAYSILHHSVATMNSLIKAVALAEDNAKLQSRDYTYSLVTNLDVLNAQNTVLQTKLNLEQARAQACLAGIQLDFAAGGTEPVSADK
jgi:outer membrane protein TolC